MTEKCGPFLAILTVLVTFFSAITPARATSDGLIAHWQFDETSGTTASDSKGGNDGTLFNGPVWQPSGGRIGGALSFDGVDDEVDTGTIPGLVAAPGSTFTFAFWYKAPPGANNGLFGWSSYRYCTTGYSADLMACSINSSSLFVLSTTIVNDNNWHHIAYTVTDSIQYLYVDGNAEDSASDTIATTNPTAGIVIGAREFGGHIQAQFDDVRIYNRALSAAEVLELYNTEYCAAPVRPEGVMFYNACCKTYQFCNGTDWVPIGSAPHCTSGSLLSNLIAHWKLDESSGTTAADSVGSNDGTLTNGPVWQPSGGRIGGALSFDGVDDYISLSSYDFGNQFTLAAWVNINPSEDNIQTVIANTTNYCGSNGFKLFVNEIYTTDARLKFETGNGTVCDVAETAAGIVPADGWHHIVASVNRTAGSATLYVDGVDQTTDSTIRTDFNTNGVRSIGSMTNGAYPFGGTVDDVRIYDRTLSAVEVGQIYNGTDMCP